MAAAPNRPQAQPAPQNGPRARILRIGVLLGGKIVEERLIRERIPVTIGQSMRNTFSIPIEGLPLELTLFALHEGKYSLHFLNKMDGRLSDAGGQVNTLDSLKARGAQNHGDYWSVPLTDSARGKLSLGDLTILFQFVAEPPRQPKPMLPASVRGTFADRFDPRLSVILGASVVAHFSIVILALLTDVDTDNGMAERAYNLTFKQDTYAVDLTPPPEQNIAGPGSAAPTPAKTPDKTPDKAPAKAPDKGAGKTPEQQQVALNEEATRYADIMAGVGSDGKTDGDMGKRAPGADLNQQINDVRDSGGPVAVGPSSGRGARGDNTHVGVGHGPDINGPGGTQSAGGGKTEEKGPQGRISVSDKQSFDESTLTPDIVLAKIQSAYMSGLKRCYKEYLKKDASARGKVTLSLTINETGRTTKGAAHGFAGEVDECIGNLMGGWRFPIPKDKDGDPTEANFAITLQLVPD